MRAADNGGPGPLRFGVYEVDLAAGELRKRGVRIPLQEKPLQVLGRLLDDAGQIVTKEDLKQAVWPDTAVELELVLSAAVSKVRRALGDSSENPRFVETVPKRGYRFIGQLKHPDRKRRALAVLPFQNLSGDTADEYLSDGLTEALITELAKAGELKVISRTSVMLYKGANKSAKVVAQELAVDTLVEGSAQREGEQIRVTAQLIDAERDDHIWAESYDRPLRSILSLQSEIARDIARRVEVSLTPSKAVAAARVDPQAYEAYLRGKYQAQRFTPEGIQSAFTYFQTSLESDPESSLTHTGLSMVYMLSTLLFWLHPRESGRRGYEAACRAVELDPMSAPAYVVRGIHEFFCRWDAREAEATFRRAIELSPNDADAEINLALVLAVLGRPGEGRAHLERALDLDPLNLMNHHLAGVYCIWSDRQEEAVERLRAVVARAPAFQLSHLTLWCALNALGRQDEALDSCITAWKCMDDTEMVRALEQGNAEGGYREAMRRAGESLGQRYDDRYIPIYILAMHYDYAGDVDKAVEWIERSYEERDHALAYIHRKPLSREFLEHPRLRAIVERVNVEGGVAGYSAGDVPNSC